MQPAFPTTEPDLNAVLSEFTTGLQAALGENLAAVYLQGSFGLGGWDNDSDVDFLAAVQREINAEELAALQALHGRIYDLPSPWAQHLEGSYFPLDILRRADPTRTLLFYLDNTARELIRSEHDNTLVVRRVVREHGIPLYGPPAQALIDPVPADDLRAEVRAVIREWGEEIFSGQYNIQNRWAQPFAVISYCRMLQTLQTGEIHSKPDGVGWGLANLDERWHDLIRRAWKERPDPSLKVRQPAAGGDVEGTLQFIRHAQHLAFPVTLRDVLETDLPIFYEQQLDPQANHMAAFTAKDPADRAAFMAHWLKIMADPSIKIQAILWDGQIAGSVLRYFSEEGPEVSYWLGREFWGQGIATRALAAFIQTIPERPLYGRVVKDNFASLRVLQKCGFSITGEGKGFANARGTEVEEYVLMLA